MAVGTQKWLGASALLTSAIIYGSYGWLTRISAHMFAITSQSALRQLVGFVIALAVVAAARHPLRLGRHRRRDMVGVCLTGPLTGLLWTYSVNNTTVASAVLSFYAGGLFTSFVAGRIVLKESITLPKGMAFALALVGFAIFAGPSDGLDVGLASGLGGGFCVGFNSIFYRQVRDLPKWTVMLYQLAAGVLIGGVAMWFAGGPYITRFDTFALVACVIYGALIVAVSWLLLFGFARFDVNSGNILVSTEIVFATVFGVLLLHEIPSIHELVGGALVMTGAIVSCLPSLSRTRDNGSGRTEPVAVSLQTVD